MSSINLSDETWRVALWLGNDEGLTSLASGCRNDKEMIEPLRECGCTETPDGVATWTGS